MPDHPAGDEECSRRETEWCDEYGTVAYGWSDGVVSCMRLPGVGVYRWRSPGATVTAAPEPGATEPVVVDTFHRCVLPMVLQTQGGQVLHASAVLLPEGVVALCARSRTGKSTLAYALSRQAEAPLWADDAVAFEARTDGGVASLRLPFELKLRDPSVAYFGVRSANGRDGSASDAPLRALFVLSRVEGLVAPRATRLTAGRAFTALLEHAYCFEVDQPSMHERMVHEYLELSARVPAFELVFPSGFEALPATVALIRDTLAREVE